LLPGKLVVPARLIVVLLSLASFVFYAYWDWRFLPLLLGSILVNHLLAKWLLRAGSQVRFVVALGIAANLACLGYFKYVDFVLGNLAVLS
jgi:alginate O-acetyltransferase complex protein AlgI